MSESRQFTTPVGHLVTGSIFEPQKTDHMGKPVTEDKWSYFIGLAFPKTTQQWWDEPDTGDGSLGYVFNQLRAAANDGYRGQEWQNAAFKWKLEDGDSPKHADKTGWKGHWILKFNRSYSIGRYGVYDNAHPNPAPISEDNPSRCKRGDYYRVSGSTRPNGAVGDQAGVYVNVNMVQWCAYGEEIASGPSAAQVFSNPVDLPPGASTTPSAPAAGMPAAPQGAPSAPSAPPASPAPAVPPQAPASPAPAAPPQAPAQTPAPAAPPTPGSVPPPSFADGGGYDGLPEKFQYQGAAYTKEQLLTAGHTEEMIATYPKA